MTTLTVIILTRNEERNIEKCVKNAKQVTEDVLVIDSGSTDKTVELARQNGARVVYRAWNNDFSAQRNFALTQTDAEWVLYLDADEWMTPELVRSVEYALAKEEAHSYMMQRKSVAFGKKFNHGVLQPDYVARMFKRKNVRWVNKVHEHPECADSEAKLEGYAEHYPYPSWKHYFTKFNRYTSIWAENAYENGKRVTLLTAYAHAIGGFFHMAVIKGGFLDGGMGIVLCCNHFTYTLMKYLKLLELQRTKDGMER